jgi:hypothetical protein
MGEDSDSDFGLEIDAELERDVESLREVLRGANTEDDQGYSSFAFMYIGEIFRCRRRKF